MLLAKSDYFRQIIQGEIMGSVGTHVQFAYPKIHRPGTSPGSRGQTGPIPGRGHHLGVVFTHNRHGITLFLR